MKLFYQFTLTDSKWCNSQIDFTMILFADEGSSILNSGKIYTEANAHRVCFDYHFAAP